MRAELVNRDGQYFLRIDEDDGYYHYHLRNKDVEFLRNSINKTYNG